VAGSNEPAWGASDIPRQDGRIALVTGANTGIGYTAASALAAQGAHVVLACRDDGRAAAAASDITAACGRPVTTLNLDLSSLSSVRRAADEFHRRFDRLDLLINNAGVMELTSPRRETEDSFERHIGINHLGPFAFTGLLLDLLLSTPGSRVVAVSSTAHRWGEIRLDDLHWLARPYRPTRAYAASKLANLMTTFELQRRLAGAGERTIAVAAHPGAARTALTMARESSRVLRAVAHPRLRWATRGLFQDPAVAALPTLRAAVDAKTTGGDFYGPAGWGELTGPPVLVRADGRTRDTAIERQLWNHSEELTGVRFTQLSAQQRLERRHAHQLESLVPPDSEADHTLHSDGCSDHT
jgi:NAD(P)-dependent dehydrogenase (short-subunit alcohol dehydrogenase family)